MNSIGKKRHTQTPSNSAHPLCVCGFSVSIQIPPVSTLPEKVTIFFFQSADSKVPWTQVDPTGCWTTQLSPLGYLKQQSSCLSVSCKSEKLNEHNNQHLSNFTWNVAVAVVFFFQKAPGPWSGMPRIPTQCFWSLRNCHETRNLLRKVERHFPARTATLEPIENLQYLDLSCAGIRSVVDVNRTNQGLRLPVQHPRVWISLSQKNPLGNPMVCTRMHSSTCFCEVFPPFQQLMGTCTIRCVS